MQQRWQKSSWQYLYMQNYREILWDVLVISCAKKTCALLCHATAHKCQELESNWGVLAFHPMTWRWAGLSTVNLVWWKNTVRLLLVGWKLRLPCPRGAGWAAWAPKSRCFSIFRSTTSFTMAGLALQAGGLGCPLLSVRSVWLCKDEDFSDVTGLTSPPGSDHCRKIPFWWIVAQSRSEPDWRRM